MAAETSPTPTDDSLLGRIVDVFLQGSLAPLVVLLALLGGAVALYVTPREEEPQIVVPLADVLVSAPGLPVAEVERQVATPLEKLLTQIDGVEHVYSTSESGRAVVSVSFYVGEDREDSLLKLYSKIYSHQDEVPAVFCPWDIVFAGLCTVDTPTPELLFYGTVKFRADGVVIPVGQVGCPLVLTSQGEVTRPVDGKTIAVRPTLNTVPDADSPWGCRIQTCRIYKPGKRQAE